MINNFQFATEAEEGCELYGSKLQVSTWDVRKGTSLVSNAGKMNSTRSV